jgi:hypothetical protein
VSDQRKSNNKQGARLLERHRPCETLSGYPDQDGKSSEQIATKGEMDPDSASSSPASQENPGLLPPTYTPTYSFVHYKRGNPDAARSSLPNKRLAIATSPTLAAGGSATKSLASRVFGGLASAVENINTFTTPEQKYQEHIMATMDTKVPKEDLDWLLESIPLEDRAKEGTDISETVMVVPCLLIQG